MLPTLSSVSTSLSTVLRTASAFVDETLALRRDYSTCIYCDNCVTACEDQGLAIYEECDMDEGEPPVVAGVESNRLADSACISCGQCAVACPVGAIVEHDDTAKVMEVLKNKGNKVVVAMCAPAFRVGIAEEMGAEPGTDGSGALVPALKDMGFDYVFDVTAAADVTILEEGGELIERIQSQSTDAPAPMPMFTSCCPGWINYVERSAPELIPHLSTCRSPQGMAASLIRNHFSKKAGVQPEDIYLVSMMPCTAKKTEIARPELTLKGGDAPETDVVLTVRETGRMLRAADIDLAERLAQGPHAQFDHFLGECSGAADLFGQSGGVMEAALRYAAEQLSGEKLASDSPLLEFEPVRGVDEIEHGIKEAEVAVPGTDVVLKVAVVHSGAALIRFLELFAEDPSRWDFIEVMACPGGCVNGGGMPYKKGKPDNVVELRAGGLVNLDRARPARVSDDTKLIHEIYDSYLGKVGSHDMHTHYSPNPIPE